MDDIITRWATDLAKYQKEFQEQAKKVSEWDRQIVDNAARVQKLYASTLEAERGTAEVERQLTMVESDQTELENWLAHYEEALEKMAPGGGGRGCRGRIRRGRGRMWFFLFLFFSRFFWGGRGGGVYEADD